MPLVRSLLLRSLLLRSLLLDNPLLGNRGRTNPRRRVPGSLPRVTGIRHWSTPDYTRVAIDVESDVKFSSQRIDSPARIFFDLRDTKLASTLVGQELRCG